MKQTWIQVVGCGCLLATSAQAQLTGLPPSGDNQKASVTQHIGPVAVTIDYSSPDVTGPNGESRRGKIWGQLVPYGLTNLGFGNGNPGPWRAGANENTVFTVSHDVRVEGKPLPAGSYGLHMIAEESGPWTVIFSHNHTSWGSFFYDPSEDALRVQVEPRESSFHEWLTYEFIDRQPASAVAVLRWEDIEVPISIEVPGIEEIYLTRIGNELRSTGGFGWQGFQQAASYALGIDHDLEQALEWADASISRPFIGQKNFTTLNTKAQILAKLGRGGEATEIMDEAIRLPGTQVNEVHQYGRQLITAGDPTKALEVFEFNRERFGDVWPVNVGLARGYSAVGEYKKALRHAEIALARAPDQLNKTSLESAVKLLAEGKDIN